MANAAVLRLVPNTETVKEKPPSQISELEILTLLQRMESKNEYLTKLVEAQTDKLADIERSNTSTTLVNTSLLFPSGAGVKYLIPTNQPYVITDWPATFLFQDAGEPLLGAKGVSPAGGVRVPLFLLLELGSAAVAVVAGGSIASWLLGGVPLLNPFASLLALIASPFFFGMGRIARGQQA